jgi:hypothetical protein
MQRNPPIRLLFSLLASVAISLIGLLLVRKMAPAGWLHANNEVAGNYLQTIGTIYAVLLAFVVFVVWQQHNEARCAVEAEANELSDLYRITHALPKSQPALDCIAAYGHSIVDEEWQGMGRGHASPKTEAALKQIWESILAITPKSNVEEALYAEALARFNDLSDARSHRLFCSLLRLPPSLWVLLMTNGCLVVGSMWIFGLASFLAHALMTIALAGSIAFILFLVADLDNPYWGSWRIEPHAFQRVLEHMH